MCSAYENGCKELSFFLGILNSFAKLQNIGILYKTEFRIPEMIQRTNQAERTIITVYRLIHTHYRVFIRYNQYCIRNLVTGKCSVCLLCLFFFSFSFFLVIQVLWWIPGTLHILLILSSASNKKNSKNNVI